MPIKVTFPGSYTVFQPSDSGAFLTALASAQVVETSGWEDNEVHKLCKNKPQIEIIDNLDFAPLPTPLQELQDRLRSSEKSWMDYYNKFNASEKKVKELEARLNEIKESVVPKES